MTTAPSPSPPPPTDADAPGAAAQPSTGRRRRGRRGGKGDSRFYVDSTGQRYWSVTTLLRGVPKDALVGWAARVTAEAAVDDMDMWRTMLERRGRDETVRALRDVRWSTSGEKADLGKAVHAAIEAWVLNAPLPDLTPLEERYVVQFLGFLERHRPEILAAELTVFNRTHGYAGKLDLIARLPRLPDAPVVMLDAKTGSGVYGEHALQLSAYANAEKAELANGHEVDLPAIDAGMVLHLTEDSWDLVPVEIGAVRETNGHVRDVFRTFLYAREIYRWLNELSVSVVSAPLPVPPLDGDRPTAIELMQVREPAAAAPDAAGEEGE